MFKYGFLRIACAAPILKIADPFFNIEKHIELIKKAEKNKSDIILFPELSITSYSCGDLFHNTSLRNKTILAVEKLLKETVNIQTLLVFGAPLVFNNKLYNTAIVAQKGKILGIVPKTYIPNYGEFYEKRWFESGGSKKNEIINLFGYDIPFGRDILFSMEEKQEVKIGVEICEDLWVVDPPSSEYAKNGAIILLNLSASDAIVTKDEYRKLLVKTQSAKTISAYAYANTGLFESTTDMVFDGSCFIFENGVEIASSKRFSIDSELIFGDIDTEFLIYERSRLTSFENTTSQMRNIFFNMRNEDGEIIRKIDPLPFVPKDKKTLEERTEEIFNIQVSGLIRRLKSIKEPKAVIGLSGGLDSTLAFLVVIEAFKRLKLPLNYVFPITMPGFGTTSKTLNNVKKLCKLYNVNLEVMDIKKISKEVFKSIGHPEGKTDIIFENTQARARTYLLMMRANQVGGIVIGTGDLSEIALGFCTYNGDHISMYNVNAGVPKTLVRFVIERKAIESEKEIKKILFEILEQPISPELLPPTDGKITQKTEEKIGPYELHDFFLYNFVRMGFSYDKILFLASIAFNGKYDHTVIEKWLKLFIDRFFTNQWKRDCVPAGPKVGSVDLSPRSSWRMPSEIEPEGFSFS
ncbi:MAG: NAD(+) synthase [Brevinematales bacterium]|nr:NAD(+) synthase [Brevinematales bacterium]